MEARQEQSVVEVEDPRRRHDVAPVLRAGAQVCVAHHEIARMAAQSRVGDASRLRKDVPG
jgi:hypothetical protein